MGQINWNDGRLITIKPGDTATCEGLNSGQLYAFMLYNSAMNDADAKLLFTPGNGASTPVTVPGTTGNQGLASVVFASGDDAQTIGVAFLNSQSGAEVQCYVASVKLPMNNAGINNTPLPADGQAHAFNKFTRYYAVLASKNYYAQVVSNINQFISIQLKESKAIVNIVNALSDSASLVTCLGNAQSQVTTRTTTQQSLSWNLSGDGSQLVFVNADSVQDSSGATISLQPLSSDFSVDE
ncbi:hypothetical protein CDL60_06135 [Roseateles noduli]|nr:hypothetical protein CDL60_06135 [Roseateles noduli]